MTLVKHNNGHIGKGSFFENFFKDDLFFSSKNDSACHQHKPAANISESKESFFIDIAAPGLTKADFNIHLEKNLLRISVAKTTETSEDDPTFRMREFNFTQFERSFRLSPAVNKAEISAKYENGVLNLTLPKREEAKEKPAREIAID